MMEAVLSLMQMAKTSIKLAQLDEAKLPYISLCTNPTTGGISASFAMLFSALTAGSVLQTLFVTLLVGFTIHA